MAADASVVEPAVAPPARPRARWPLVVVAAVAVALLSLATWRLLAPPGQDRVRVAAPGRPELALPLPTFSLVDQDGRAVTLADLRGRVWIASFIFTRCPSICPRLTTKMAALVDRTKGEEHLAFVSISVDPDNDPPPVLRAYGERYGADFARWRFLTGDQKTLEATVVQGFKVALGRDDTGAIVHAERFVLVDAEGRIRGYYDADDAGQRDLLEAARRLTGAL